MIPYATSTGTKRNIDAMRGASWHLLLTPDRRNQKTWGLKYAIDNGAWAAYCNGRQFDDDAFRRLFNNFGRDAQFAVVPDIVAAGHESLAYSLRWLDECKEHTDRVLLAVQDGMTADMLRPHVGGNVGLFVGGTTEWKLETMPAWGELAKDAGCYLHVGRVNSMRRIRYCAGIGADSFDGTSATRYAVTLPKLDFARRQEHLAW